MKKYLIFALIGVICALAYQSICIANIIDEREVYRANVRALNQEVEEYRTKDSLNAIQAEALTLTIDEYKQYRAEDLATISTLETKNRQLQNVTKSSAVTKIEMTGKVKDSIIYKDRYIVDTLRCIDVGDSWYSLHGCTDSEGNFNGTFNNMDSLMIVVSVRYKRFLGFLWRTSKIKDRHIDAVSKNPHTRINDIEYIELRQ